MRRSKATSIADSRAASNTPRYTFVGGKGGVGKTTCAAAMAIRAARAGFATLVISTDPAPSLGDALDQRLAATPRPVARVRGLHAVEVDAARALDSWIARRRATLEEIALRGTWLDRDDVSRLLKLSLPGIDEVAALLQIAELGGSDRYDRIVVDTAPTGHLLRMMEMPGVLNGIAVAFDHMQAKHRIMVEAIRGGWTPDAADLLIQQIGEDAERMAALLRDATQARVAWVTLPEQMAVEETVDALAWLAGHGMTVDMVLVNRVTLPPPQRCRWCQARRRVERAAIDRLRRVAPGRLLIPIPVASREPRGVAALGTIGDAIDRPAPIARASAGRAAAHVTASLHASLRLSAAPSLVDPDTRLVMFGGKGGVGKTTCAAAVAVTLAVADRRKRVLLLSADPAHSLGDVLGAPVTDGAAPIRGGPANLSVRELDAQRALQQLRNRLADAIEELFARLSGSGAIETGLAGHDRRVMRDLVDLAPPGIDELVAMIEVLAVLDQSSADNGTLLVIDTAPTGHALRLIEMPALVHDWVKALMGILLKYQPVVGVGQLGAVLLKLSQGLGRLRELMADPVRTRFIAITRAAALPREETVRLLKRLEAAGVSAPVTVVNAAGAGTCRRCRADAATQAKEIGALQRQTAVRGRSPATLVARAEMPPPHGPRELRAWHSTWEALASARPRPRSGAVSARGRRS